MSASLSNLCGKQALHAALGSYFKSPQKILFSLLARFNLLVVILGIQHIHGWQTPMFTEVQGILEFTQPVKTRVP